MYRAEKAYLCCTLLVFEASRHNRTDDRQMENWNSALLQDVWMLRDWFFSQLSKCVLEVLVPLHLGSKTFIEIVFEIHYYCTFIP
jgi:hypothetical protein